METLLINLNTEQSVGTDTEWTVLLDKTYSCKKIILH